MSNQIEWKCTGCGEDYSCSLIVGEICGIPSICPFGIKRLCVWEEVKEEDDE